MFWQWIKVKFILNNGFAAKSHTMSCYCIELNPIQQERWGSIPVFSEGWGVEGGSVSLAWDRGTTSIEWESGESGKNTSPDFIKSLFWIFDRIQSEQPDYERGFKQIRFVVGCVYLLSSTKIVVSPACLIHNIWNHFRCWKIFVNDIFFDVDNVDQCDVPVIEQNVISRLDKICRILLEEVSDGFAVTTTSSVTNLRQIHKNSYKH